MPGQMERVTVRCVEGDEFLTLSYVYGNKQNNMLRPKTETLEKSLDRIKANIIKLAKKGNKKTKKTKLDVASSQSNESIEVKCTLTKNGVELEKTELNKDAWVEGAVLQIQDRTYEVYKNLPKVLSLKLPSTLMVGCPVYPRVEVEFTQHKNCSFIWYQSKISQLSLGNKSLQDGASESSIDVAGAVPMDVDHPDGTLAAKSEPVAKIKAIECQWTEVCRDRVLIPTEKMLGSKLKLQCVPR